MSSLLSGVHRQILASRLRDLCASSPLVLVYQTLGGKLRGAQLEDSLQAALDKELPKGHGIRPVSFKVKNTVAAAVEGGVLASIFHASNILVGWQLPPQASAPASSSPSGAAAAASPPAVPSTSGREEAMPPPRQLTRRDAGLPSVLAGAMEAAAASPARWPPHSTLSVLLRLGLKLPSDHPVALLACLHRGRAVRVSQLEQWAKLDDHATMGGLLAQLESPAEALLTDLDAAPQQLVATLSALGPDDLLDCLEASRPAGVESAPL